MKGGDCVKAAVIIPTVQVAFVVLSFHSVPRLKSLLLSFITTTTIHLPPAANLETRNPSDRTHSTVHRIQCPHSKICSMYATDDKKAYSKPSCTSLRFINVFIFSSICPWNSILSPSLESAVSSTWGSRYWCRPHAFLASSKRTNFLSIYATVMTPLISNSPAAVEAHLGCMQWQLLINNVGAAESLSGLTK